MAVILEILNCMFTQKKQSNINYITFVDNMLMAHNWGLMALKASVSLELVTITTGYQQSKDTSTALSDMFCTMTDLITLCPTDTGPKSVTI